MALPSDNNDLQGDNNDLITSLSKTGGCGDLRK